MDADYVQELVDETVQMCDTGAQQLSVSVIPSPLSSQYKKPVKALAVKSHKSHFSLP